MPLSSGQQYWRMASGLILVLLLIAVLVWLSKRLQKGGFRLYGGMRCLSGLSLGTRERLMLIEVGQRYVLLGVTAHQITLLCDFGNNKPEGFDSVNKPSFSQILQRAKGKKNENT